MYQMEMFPEDVAIAYPVIPRISDSLDMRPLDDIPISNADIENAKIVIKLINKDDTILDTATFSSSEIEEAIGEFLRYVSYKKRLILSFSEKEVVLFEAIENKDPVLVLTDEYRKRYGIDNGALGKIIDSYVDSIGKVFLSAV